MSVNFTIHGPFVVPTAPKKIKGGIISIPQLKDVNATLWKSAPFSEYANKKGCYVFANAVTRGSKPIYVGKTNISFKDECFSTHKKAMLNDFLACATKTGLQIYFVVLNNRKDCPEEIDLCETLLIQKCKDASKYLLNIRKLSEKFTIDGVHGPKNPGKPTCDVLNFKKCLNIK